MSNHHHLPDLQQSLPLTHFLFKQVLNSIFIRRLQIAFSGIFAPIIMIFVRPLDETFKNIYIPGDNISWQWSQNHGYPPVSSFTSAHLSCDRFTSSEIPEKVVPEYTYVVYKIENFLAFFASPILVIDRTYPCCSSNQLSIVLGRYTHFMALVVTEICNKRKQLRYQRGNCFTKRTLTEWYKTRSNCNFSDLQFVVS